MKFEINRLKLRSLYLAQSCKILDKYVKEKKERNNGRPSSSINE